MFIVPFIQINNESTNESPQLKYRKSHNYYTKKM
jgi:hypothetical protein